MSGPQAVRTLPMGVLYPRRGTTNKERRPERQIETRRSIWRICLNTWTAQVYQPINSLCAYTTAVEFSPLYCKSVLLTDEAHCHQKLELNAGGRRYRVHVLILEVREGGAMLILKPYHCLFTLWPKSKMATRFMCVGPFASLVGAWNQLLRFFIYYLLNCELRKRCYIN